MSINITLDQIKSSKRLSRLENEIVEICKKSKKPVEIIDLKRHFPRRASLETTFGVVSASENISLYLDEFAYYGFTADISYTISGGDVYKVIIGGKSGNPQGDTIYGAWMSDNYEYELDINQNGHGTWTYKTTEISVNDGSSRSSGPVVSSDPDYFNIIPTY